MKYLHTMLRVKNLDTSLRFYTEVLGLQLRFRRDYPDGKFTLAFLGDGEGEPFLELTHNWDKQDYNPGDAYGHVAFAVRDIYAACDRIRAAGGKIVREPGPMKHGTTVLAFIEDPDAYKIELIERKSS